ncbi:MAG: hypothetical protein ACI9FD_003493 [Gammaproteobacteria bacterium]
MNTFQRWENTFLQISGGNLSKACMVKNFNGRRCLGHVHYTCGKMADNTGLKIPLSNKILTSVWVNSQTASPPEDYCYNQLITRSRPTFFPMIISDSKKFVFVHIEKAAGTSIRHAILPYALPRPYSTWFSLLRLAGLPRGYRNYKFRTHAPVNHLISRMPRSQFDSYFKFAFVRNPWDRLVSEYNAAIKKNKNRRHHKIGKMGSFYDFIQHEINRGKFFQETMLVDRTGELCVDYVGRFENLAEDFSHICSQIGIESTLDHVNRYDHMHYREFYNNASRELVAIHWRRDIETFGYEF